MTKTRAFLKSASWVCALSLAVIPFGCGGDEGGRNSVGGGNGSGGTSGPGPNPGSGGSLQVPVNPGTNDDDRDLPVRTRVCDANGENCTCLRLALLGTLESAADHTDTQPFVDWLNGNSDGTATVTMVTTKPTLDAAWLGNYDILLVANVNAWTFNEAEKAAVETWVRETGGGIIALTGFTSEAAIEPAASSQLISFAGLSFRPPDTATSPQSENLPLYFKGGSTNLRSCIHWNGSVGDPQITAPIKFTPQTGSLEDLTYELDQVGAFWGYTVEAPGGATIVATDPVTGGPIAAAYEVDETGRIFAFGDEWVIFANQWNAAGTPHNQQQDEYNPCWVPPEGDQPGYFHSVESLYQTKQFWYNAINWVAPPNECNFVVQDPGVILR